jgi:hypothetical protein
MPRRNRVDPWGDLHAVSARGLFTGNRGCIVDEREQVVRHHRSSTLWITCLIEFRDWRVPLARPNRWTPIFFLDDAVALAAGHRPCATCRRDLYRTYRDAVDVISISGSELRCQSLRTSSSTSRPPARKTSPALRSAPAYDKAGGLGLGPGGVPRVLDDHADERVGLNDLAAHPQPHCSEPGRVGSRHQEPRRKQVLVALLLGNGGHTLEDVVHALEQSVEGRHVHAQGARSRSATSFFSPS